MKEYLKYLGCNHFAVDPKKHLVEPRNSFNLNVIEGSLFTLELSEDGPLFWEERSAESLSSRLSIFSPVNQWPNEDPLSSPYDSQAMY